MSPIITQPGAPAHIHPDEAARKRRDRLARATAEQARVGELECELASISAGLAAADAVAQAAQRLA